MKWLVRFFNLFYKVVSLSVSRGKAVIPLVELAPTATTTLLAYPFWTNEPAFKNGLSNADLISPPSYSGSTTEKSEDSTIRQSAGILWPTDKRMMSPTTISHTDMLKVAPYFPLNTVTFSSMIYDYNQINCLSFIQSATVVINIISNPKTIMLIPCINPLTLPLSITPPIEDSMAVPNTIHQIKSFAVCFNDSMMLAGFDSGFKFSPNL